MSASSPPVRWLGLARYAFLLASLALAAAFVFASNYYPSTRQRIEQDPHVVNLAKAGITARIAFGASPSCEGGRECWTDPAFDDGGWLEARLPLSPNANIRSLPGYDVGLQSGWMYYRISFEVPESLRGLSNEISFTPVYILHRYFEAHLEGRLVYVGNGVGRGQTANLPIPRSDLAKGRVTFVFKASVTPEDTGIAHYTSILVGDKSKLDDVSIHQERANYTYYLLFLLTKGAIFVIFTLFFYYTRERRGLVGFLVFALFVTVENFFIGEFLGTLVGMNVRVLCFYTSKAAAVAGLLAFFVAFFEGDAARRWTVPASLVAVAVVAGMAIDFGWGTKTITYAHLWTATNTWLVLAVVTGVVLGALDARKWRRSGAAGDHLDAVRSLTIFLGVYLGLVIWEFYFKPYGGFDKRAVFDLALFIFLAFSIALDMGLKEGQIKTLQGHMLEKQRMQAELTEAAEIAKAFLPDSAPRWDGYEVSAFHKPFTENSGDWFAFERAPTRRLYHFLMCDITGHGVQAALVVSTCKTVLSLLKRREPALLDSPEFVLAFMRELNGALFANGGGYHVSTLLGLTLSPDEGAVYHISAGHPDPLLVPAERSNPARTTPKALTSRHSVLGIRSDFEGTLKRHAFKPGDDLIAYTDGLPLRGKLKALLSHLESNAAAPDAEGLCKALAAGANDDVSVIWIRAVA